MTLRHDLRHTCTKRLREMVRDLRKMSMRKHQDRADAIEAEIRRRTHAK